MCVIVTFIAITCSVCNIDQVSSVSVFSETKQQNVVKMFGYCEPLFSNNKPRELNVLVRFFLCCSLIEIINEN